MSPKKYLYALKLRKIFVLAIWPPKLQLTNWSSSVQLSWLPSQDAWGAEEFLNKSSRKPAAVTATDPPDTGHNHTRRKNHKSGRENLSWNHSQLCVLLLPFIWSPSSLGGVHCAQRVGAHVNVHGCDGGGLVGRGEVEWHDICTNHQSTRWWVVVAGMVVPAGQATDGLATVQVSQWSALCAAAVPSPSCCRPATLALVFSVQPRSSQPRNLASSEDGRPLPGHGDVCGLDSASSVDWLLCHLCETEPRLQRREGPLHPAARPPGPAQCRPVTRESLTAKCRRGMLTNHRPRCYVKRGGVTAGQPISERHLKADTSGKKSIMMI